MQTLLIGDVHACNTELLRLLDAAGLVSEDRVIAMGDIVDRGPAVSEVLNFFQSQAYAAALMGNHERKHIRWSQNMVRPALSQKITREQLGQAYEQSVAFFESLPLYLDLPEAVLVHGYLEPGVALELQREAVLCGTRSGEGYLTGHYDRPWYELVAVDKPVVCGHRDYLKNGQPFVYDDRIFGLDTSCVHGKRLTGLLLPGFRFVSVPAEKNYWSETRRAFRSFADPKKQQLQKTSIDLPWEEADVHLLARLIEHIKHAHEQVTAQLKSDPDYETLPARQQAKRYAALVSGSNLAVLLHMERGGELSLERARRILHSPRQASEILADLEV